MAALTLGVIVDALEALNMRPIPAQRHHPAELAVLARMILADIQGWTAERFLAAAGECRRRSPWLPDTSALIKADADIRANAPQALALPEFTSADLARFEKAQARWLPKIKALLASHELPGCTSDPAEEERRARMIRRLGGGRD